MRFSLETLGAAARSAELLSRIRTAAEGWAFRVNATWRTPAAPGHAELRETLAGQVRFAMAMGVIHQGQIPSVLAPATVQKVAQLLREPGPDEPTGTLDDFMNGATDSRLISEVAANAEAMAASVESCGVEFAVRMYPMLAPFVRQAPAGGSA